MLEPMSDRLIVKMIEEDKITKGGIILTGAKDKSNLAEVIEVGKDVKGVRVSDKVLINDFGGIVTLHEGVSLVVIKLCDVLAVVN